MLKLIARVGNISLYAVGKKDYFLMRDGDNEGAWFVSSIADFMRYIDRKAKGEIV